VTDDSARDIVTKLSRRSVADTVSALTSMISAKGMTLFAVIDQSAAAGLDLPLKVLVWADEGQTKVTYYDPASLAARHHLDADLAKNLAGINALTDALVAS
jgi:uncharacterized protein (DUF302 family)